MENKILDKIEKANDVKKLSEEEAKQLAQEIREFLIEKLSVSGGHLASNLGAIELTIALHRVLDFPQDKLIWDVGHQCYTHKILTGRKEGFDQLRKTDHMSGFPKREESPCDAFDTGHSSTSISAGLGYVQARDLQGEDYRVVSVIGDGALTGGIAYEAINNAAGLKKNFIIILNDNNMSISQNVGGMSSYLGRLRTAQPYTELKESVKNHLMEIPKFGDQMIRSIRKTKNGIKQMVLPGMVFENLGLTYLGPVDGHNISAVEKVLGEAKQVDGAVLVHVTTKKGMGYEPAMRHPARFHGTSAFDIETGLPKKKSKAGYSDIFSTVMRKFGDRNEKVVAVTAAMPTGTGLNRFAHMFPERFFDVGIAEEHAVTFCAGLALGGLIPVFAVYSSFLQRAFDLILHDVCMQNLHVIFAIDRAGIVGSDGATHHGCFDLTYLSMMPNMTVMAPKNKWELSDMLKFAVAADGPLAIRYPRGEAYDGLEDHRAPMEMGKAEVLYEGSDVALLAVGSMVKVGEEVREQLAALGIQATLVNMRFVKPFDKELIEKLQEDHKKFVTLEENVLAGGFGQQCASWFLEKYRDADMINVGIADEFVSHGSVDELMRRLGMDSDSICQRIMERWYR